VDIYGGVYMSEYMLGKVKLCRFCKDNHCGKYQYPGYYFLKKIPQDNSCYYCGNQLEDTILTQEEMWDIDIISRDISFLEAMIDLKEKDPIEFQLKMSQFRNQLQQQKQIKQAEKESSKPRCPHCNSTDIKSVSVLDRGASIAFWGIFSKKINKSFECRNCGYTW